MTTGPWPFVGRDDVIARLLAALAEPRNNGAVISGPPGIGKTRLADELIARAGRTSTLRLTGSPGSHTIPYAAVAHLVAGETFDTAAGADPARVLADVRRHLDPETGRTIVMADDVSWIDDASIALLGHLLTTREVFLVATMRSGTTMSPALDALVRSFHLEFLHPALLSDAELVEAAEQFLGAALDPRSADRITHLCGGNPLYLRELLLHGSASGQITIWPSGLAWLEPDLAPAGRLVELIGERVAAIAPDLVDLLRLLAVAETATMDDLDRLGAMDSAVELERQGWLHVDGTRGELVVRLAHPLHAEVLRTTMGELDQRRQLVRAIEMVAGRPAPRADDALTLSIWRLDAGLPIDDPTVLLRGARRAMEANDIGSTIRLASALDSIDPTPESQYLAMNALFLSGRFDEVIAVARRPLPSDIDVIGLLLHTSVHLYSLLWGSCDVDRAADALERVRPMFAARGVEAWADAMLALLWSNDARTTEALALLGPSPEDPMLQFLSATQRASSWIIQGRFVDAREEADRARAFMESTPGSRTNPGFFALTQGMARAALGDTATAIEILTQAHTAARNDQVTFVRSLLAVFLADVHLVRGHLDDAEMWFLDAVDAAGSVGVRASLRVATAGLAAIAGQRGDVEGARRHLATLDDLGDDLGFLRVETAIGRTWALHATGRADDALALLRAEAAAACDRDEWYPVTRAALECARLGDAAGAAEIARSVPVAEGPLMSCWHAAIAAFATADTGLLADAQALAEAVGTDLLTAELAAARSDALIRDGDARAAAAVAADGARAATRCRGAATPRLPISAPPTLSRREQEIAELAVEGLSNTEIAERLYLSRRTVENHLQRVYVKLGVASRTDLAAAL